MMATKKLQKTVLSVLLGVLAVLFLLPLIMTVTDSFMNEDEINANYGMVASDSLQDQTGAASGKYANMKFIPDVVTLEQYYTALVKRIQFLIMFWNSVKLVLPILF